MKKISVAIAASLAGCACAGSWAQSTITPYGTIDTAMEYQNGGAGAVTRLVSSGLYATVYGFRGTENLGHGLHVNFQLEDGFDVSTGAASDPAAAFNRLAWVGFSGDFGEVRVGRQKKPEYLLLNNESDPTGVKSIASPINNFGTNSVRSSNAVSYFTPVYHGFGEQFMVSLRETPGAATLLSYNAVVRYVYGQLRVLAGYERTANPTTLVEQKVLREVVSYGIGQGRVYAAYQREGTDDHLEKLQIFEISGSWQFDSASQLSLLYGFARDDTGKGDGGQQLGMLYQYALSKRTGLYSAAGILQNRNNAQFTLDGTQYSGIPGAPGAYVHGINFGITHKF